MHRPTTEAQLAAIISDAAARGRTLAISGSGSRPGTGPGLADEQLDVTGFSGAIHHDPAELLLTAPAAAPIVQLVALLAGAGQCLAFEPPSPHALWGRGEGTLGGAIASGLSGPRRPFAGAARDHVLEVRGVTGRGEIFRAGGKVLKNVTGFDLPRLLTGARGQLAVLTEITVKLQPFAPAQATLQLPADTAEQAVRLMADALMVDGGISGAAWADGQVRLRIEAGTALPAMLADLRSRLPAGSVIEGEASRALWAGLASHAGHVRPDDIVWRCPLPATRAAALAIALPSAGRLLLDWGGALAFVLLPPDMADFDMHAAVAKAAGREGHAVRLRGDSATIPARAPLDPALALLNARVKAQFDPHHILNPGLLP